jgi:hypothetical protein
MSRSWSLRSNSAASLARFATLCCRQDANQRGLIVRKPCSQSLLHARQLDEDVERGVEQRELAGRLDELHQADVRLGTEEQLVEVFDGCALGCVRAQIDVDFVEDVCNERGDR